MNLHSRKSYVLVAAGLGLGACAAQVGPANTELGAVAVALESTGASGTTYRLAGTFVMDDPEATAFVVTEQDTSDDILLSPRVGSYSLELCDGTTSTNTDICPTADPWTLYRMECSDASAATPAQCAANGGALNPVPVDGAVLISENPQATNVQAGQASSVMFAFSVPGDGTVVFARGDVNVDFSVSEGLADGSACSTDVECQSHVCGTTSPRTCQPATCQDGVQNGVETGPDCGGNCTVACSTDSTTGGGTDPNDTTSGGTSSDPNNPDDTTSGNTTNDTTSGGTSSDPNGTTSGSTTNDPTSGGTSSDPNGTTSGSTTNDPSSGSTTNDTTSGSSSTDSGTTRDTTSGSSSTDSGTTRDTTTDDTLGGAQTRDTTDDTTAGAQTRLAAAGESCTSSDQCASGFCFLGSCF